MSDPGYVIEPAADPRLDPAAALPEPEEANPWPAPLVTSLDPWPDGIVAPSGVAVLERKLDKLGWEHRTGYAYGFKPGRTKGSWAPLETVGVWCRKDGMTSIVFTWERSPESTAAGGPEWKPAGAVQHDAAGRARKFTQTEGKRLL